MPSPGGAPTKQPNYSAIFNKPTPMGKPITVSSNPIGPKIPTAVPPGLMAARGRGFNSNGQPMMPAANSTGQPMMGIRPTINGTVGSMMPGQNISPQMEALLKVMQAGPPISNNPSTNMQTTTSMFGRPQV